MNYWDFVILFHATCSLHAGSGGWEAVRSLNVPYSIPCSERLEAYYCRWD